MNNKKINIIIAYIFNILLIFMSFFMMEQYVDELLLLFIIVGVIYLIYWIVCNIKRYMDWKVYKHLCIGVLIQILLNFSGIIPEDGGFLAGIGQAVYIVFLIIFVAIIGIINFIMYAIYRKKIKTF